MSSGPSSQAKDVAYHLHSFTNLREHEQRGPLIIDRGAGVYLYDSEGKRYLDGMASLWCCSLGYDEPRLLEAASRQMAKLPYSHTFRGRANGPALELAEQLIEAVPMPMSRVFFANSGSEANETAVKLAWYYNHSLGRPGKRKIITREGAYHGTTVLASSLSGLPSMHSGFNFSTDYVLRTGCPHHYRHAFADESEEDFATRLARELEELIVREDPDTIAAFIAEPVMGVGGVIVPPETYFEKVQKVLSRHDILLIADEVICAFGRTGNFLGSETVGMQPDIITMAKALSSAYFPISAVMVSDSIYRAVRDESDRLGVFSHGLTYSGHPVAAAVALETLAIYRERGIVKHVARMGQRLKDGLNALADSPLIGEVRGVGLMHAVELVADKESKQPFGADLAVGRFLMDNAEENGLFVRAVGDTILVAPPLVLEEQEVDALLRLLGDALRETERHVASTRQ